MHHGYEFHARWVALAALVCACGAETTEAPLDVHVEADAETRALVRDVTVRVETRDEHGKSWELLTEPRFELRDDLDLWPLHFQIDPPSPGAEYSLHAIARDSRDAVVVEAHAVATAEQARMGGLRVRLELAAPEPDGSPMPKMPRSPIAPECIDKPTDAPFCEGERMYLCTSGERKLLPCGENERCVSIDSQAPVCACQPGFVDAGGTGCVRPSN